MKLEHFYDLVVQVAITRLGPIVGQMLHPYLRRQELEAPVSLHPLLDQVLERTLGVPLFQEQLLRMAMIVTNFIGGEAEDLRRAMGFKRSKERMQNVEAKLRVGMTANGINTETQERIIQSITSFALYGLPESYAASFALIAYASAYLKCYYLATFTACMLNHQPMGLYSAATLVKDAQRHGQRFRPVNVQVSAAVCRIEREGGIRFSRLGLNYVKGLSQRSTEALLGTRENAGPFDSLTDLLRRAPSLNKKEVNALAELGALNSLPQRKQDRHRRGTSWQVQATMQPVGPLLESIANDGDHSPLPAMTPKQRVTADFAQSGLTIGSHPMTFHRTQLRAKAFSPQQWPESNATVLL